MVKGLTLDAGALIAAEKRSPIFWTQWAAALRRDLVITVPAVVIAQAWRGDSHGISRVLKAVVVEDLTRDKAMYVGRLLAASRTADVIDAAVVVGAASRGDAVLTSDPDDLARLATALGARVPIITV